MHLPQRRHQIHIYYDAICYHCSAMVRFLRRISRFLERFKANYSLVAPSNSGNRGCWGEAWLRRSSWDLFVVDKEAYLLKQGIFDGRPWGWNPQLYHSHLCFHAWSSGNVEYLELGLRIGHELAILNYIGLKPSLRYSCLLSQNNIKTEMESTWNCLLAPIPTPWNHWYQRAMS